MTRDHSYHEGLQALRGVLALSVFVHHVFWNASAIAVGPSEALYSLRLGSVGVLGFFALSGFLIASKAGDPAGKFAVDRIRRIVPTFWLSLAAATLIAHLQGTLTRVPWDAAFLLPTGWRIELPLPHWSLYFEAFFYLLVWSVARLRASWVPAAVLIWAPVSFFLSARPYDFANYSPPTLFHLACSQFSLFFAAGVVAGWRFVPRRSMFVTYATIAFIGLFWPTFMTAGRFAFGAVPSPVARAAVLFVPLGALCAVRAAMCWRQAGPIGRALCAVGDMSYGVYMFHVAIMAIVVWMLQHADAAFGYTSAAVLIAVVSLPPALLAGVMDMRIQRLLKRRLTPYPRGDAGHATAEMRGTHAG